MVSPRRTPPALGPLLGLLLAPGCAPFRALELPASPAHTDPNHQTQMGLTIAARLLDDPLSKEYHFGADLRDSEYIPVLVSIENRGNGAFGMRRSDFHLVLENGERFDAVPPGDIFSALRRSPVAAFLLAPLIVPPLLIARDVSDYNFELVRSLSLKSFPGSLRIEAGDPPSCRAVFFRDPARSSRSTRALESATLQLVVEKEGERPEDSAPPGTGPPTPHEVGNVLTFTLALARESFP